MSKILEKMKNFFYKYSKPIKESSVFIGYVLALIFLFVFVVNISIFSNTNDNIYSIDEIIKIDDNFDCIIVLGAGVRADGSPTPMLNDRLTAAYEAFVNNKSDVILISGDSEDVDYTETVTMKNVLVSKGIEESIIICDGYGLSTYESIWRAKFVYGYDKILIISQKYHLHRAIYIAKEMGMVAEGVDAALQGYSKQPIYSLREYLARVKDLLYAEMRPAPKYTAKWEEIYE